MKFTILLKHEDHETAPLTVGQIEWTGPLQAATLGLTLEESKRILAKVQKELVESQIKCYVKEQRFCAQCGSIQILKDYHTVCFKSLFGGVSLRIRSLRVGQWWHEPELWQPLGLDGMWIWDR